MNQKIDKEPAQELDPWPVILGHLFELDSFCIPGVIEKSGMAVDWNLSRQENYSHKYRIAAYRPRINAAYEALSKEVRLRVAFIVADEIVKLGMGERLDTALRRVGWCIDSGQLVPADESVRELFFPKGSQHDAYVRIREIFQGSKSSLRVIDPYLDRTIFTVLGDLEGLQKVELLTNKVPSDFAHEATKFEQQHRDTKIEVRRSNEFHDRFVVIDNDQCWHVGCSLKDAGNRAFMLSLVEDQPNREALLRSLDGSWSRATPLNS